MKGNGEEGEMSGDREEMGNWEWGVDEWGEPGVVTVHR
jgi:hypothetical protein